MIKAIVLMAVACSEPAPKEKDNLFIVSILPLKYIVESITGSDFQIEVLVPPGASPETYDLTPAQLVRLADAQALFMTGLIDFETGLTDKLTHGRGMAARVVDLSRGIELIEGTCSHVHAREGEASPGNSAKNPKKIAQNEQHNHHIHGVDPHIWTSPPELKMISRNVYERIALLYPDSTKYAVNHTLLQEKLDSLDGVIRAKTDASSRKSFLIYHPALAYWARAYGFEQIALEDEGKEPSAEYLKTIVDRARREGLRTVFYQVQFSRKTVETLAAEIGAEPVKIDPLAENVIANIGRITDLITEY